MPEKLINIEEACALLGIAEDAVKELVEKGNLPAYKIGGKFLRFRKEQLEAIRNGSHAASGVMSHTALPAAAYPNETHARTFPRSRFERIQDFFYFNDFYIISAVVTFLILFFIFK